jgi:hypothetical protein
MGSLLTLQHIFSDICLFWAEKNVVILFLQYAALFLAKNDNHLAIFSAKIILKL